jgi:hypothetical protein
MKYYPEDPLIAVALELLEFWDLDKSSQDRLIKSIIIRILNLESELHTMRVNATL